MSTIFSYKTKIDRGVKINNTENEIKRYFLIRALVKARILYKYTHNGGQGEQTPTIQNGNSKVISFAGREELFLAARIKTFCISTVITNNHADEVCVLKDTKLTIP